MNLAVAAAVFVATAAIEALWVLYVDFVAKRRPIRAGLVSSLQHLLGAGCVIEYTRNQLYLVSLALGALIGATIGVVLLGPNRD